MHVHTAHAYSSSALCDPVPLPNVLGMVNVLARSYLYPQLDLLSNSVLMKECVGPGYGRGREVIARCCHSADAIDCALTSACIKKKACMCSIILPSLKLTIEPLATE